MTFNIKRSPGYVPNSGGIRGKIVRPPGFSFRYYRFNMTKNKYASTGGDDGGTQFKELELTLNGVRVDYTGATASTSMNSPQVGQYPSEAIDNNTITKWYSNNNPPGTFTIDFGTARQADAFRYLTAEDVIPRDPIRWTFEGSNDNTNWTILHTQSTDAVITDSRTTWTQSFPFS